MKNELIRETSPYLLQHAHNPVHWQPWSEKIFTLAKELNKPVLVSIGYSACHWCHVMERESFENETVAGLMNDYFINVKIDREERPDIDHLYMDAVQAMTGSGGWPLNVFLTPEGKPFYGGTYFPPVKAFNRASWTDVLKNIHAAWQERREELEQQAETLTDHLEKSNDFGRVKNAAADEISFTKADCETIKNNLLSVADKTEGGFGRAPKFPQTFSINCLLEAAYYLDDKDALAHAELSLQKMFHGGIYDQLAGGLCRYSTDDEWLAPHFEKMLYDNALFIIALSNAYLFTKNKTYQQAIIRTCDFLFTEMKDKNGGFYAALDADSEGEEGKFYVWDKKEIVSLLGDDADFFCEYFDVSERGNWEGKNILRIRKPLKETAVAKGITFETAGKIISDAVSVLLQRRNKRIRPGTDDKILMGWNALLISAFCKAYAAVPDEKYKNEAVELFEFIERSFCEKDERYFHTYKNGHAKYPAFLDDYAYFIDACIQLQEITGEQKYLIRARKITEYVTENFEDASSGFFYFTSKEQKDILLRKTDLYDGAVPSGNSVMAKNILYLSVIFDERQWNIKATGMISSLKEIILKHPGSFGIWAAAGMEMAAGINEISVIGNDLIPQLKEVLHGYMPNRVLQSASAPSEMPLLANKSVFQKTFLYLCRNFECKPPVATAGDLFQAAEKERFNKF